jgi:hypothetical protein
LVWVLALRYSEEGPRDYGESLALVKNSKKQSQREVGKIVLHHSSQFRSFAVSLCVSYDAFPCPLGHSNTLDTVNSDWRVQTDSGEWYNHYPDRTRDNIRLKLDTYRSIRQVYFAANLAAQLSINFLPLVCQLLDIAQPLCIRKIDLPKR